MAEVTYIAGTSKPDEEPLEPSVEILEPKVRSISFSTEENVLKIDDKTDDHPNRPSDSLWKQQKLPAWQPILTADTVLPAFFLLGIALTPIGIGLLLSSNDVKEITYEYTDCTAFGDKVSKKCSDILKDNRNEKCKCRHNFLINDDMKAPVFFYYGLSGFYQNHRRYVQSRDNNQLMGKKEDVLDKYCEPFRYDKEGRHIGPCGAIANSLFNDTFKLYIQIKDSLETVDLVQTEIAWPTDKKYKYKNPDQWPPSGPPFWQKRVDDLDPNHPNNNGYQNEHFIIWMRTAALPTFRKLWARIDHDQNVLWRTLLPKGNYTLEIDYNYPVVFGKYKAGKHFYISNTSWLGGKNNFLGYAYIVVGGICLLLWICFLILVKKYGQKAKDIVDIGPKTSFVFSKSQPNYSSDGSTQPLKPTNTSSHC